MLPILISIGRLLASSAIFAATERVLENLIDKDDETVADEFLAAGAAAGFLGITERKKIIEAISKIPNPIQVTDARSAADFFEKIIANKQSFEALNSRLGGFAPLAIKATKAFGTFLTKRNILFAGGIVVAWKFIGWLVWLPQLIQQVSDHGVFAPEQANEIMESWGLPFRWPISEVRKIQIEREKQKLKAFGGTFESEAAATFSSTPRFTEVTRITQSKTAKPKLFLGTIFSGKVAPTMQFVRAVDDEITSDEDLVNDVQINMTRWLVALPGRLSYEIQVKLNPYDEEGVRKAGTWAVLGLYINNKKGQRTFIDEILLGPMDPVVYYPEQTRIESIQFQIPSIVKPAEIQTLKAGQNVFFTVDETGNVVSDIFKEDAGAGAPAPAGPGASVQTGEGATPPAGPAQAPTPQPQSQPPASVVSPTFSIPSAAPAQSVYQSVPQEIRVIAQPGAASFPYRSDAGGNVEQGATLIKTANNQYYAINPNGDRPNITQRDFEFITGPVGRITSTLRVGSFGDEVKMLQTLLRNKGFDPGAIDGSFGPRTDSAVRAFQASRAVTADGIVGPVTRGLLQG